MFALETLLGNKTAGEDFALGFWQKSSSIFLKFIFKLGGSADDQTELSAKTQNKLLQLNE